MLPVLLLGYLLAQSKEIKDKYPKNNRIERINERNENSEDG